MLIEKFSDWLGLCSISFVNFFGFYNSTKYRLQFYNLYTLQDVKMFLKEVLYKGCFIWSNMQ